MVPTHPGDFRGVFAYCFLEEDNNRKPASYAFEPKVPLQVSLEDGALVLRGRPSPFTLPCLNIPFTHHNYAMYFAVECTNANDKVNDKILWRRSVDRRFLHHFFNHESKTTLELEGDAPDVPLCDAAVVTMTLERRKHDYHLAEVVITIPLDYYNRFIERYNESEK